MAALLDALRPIVEIVLSVLLDLIRQRRQPTAEDAAPDRDTRDRLRASIRQWLIVAIVLPILLLPGCGVRTIYVPHGTPVRLRETAKDVKVWVKDAKGEPVAGRMDIPEGWYALPLEEDE